MCLLRRNPLSLSADRLSLTPSQRQEWGPAPSERSRNRWRAACRFRTADSQIDNAPWRRHASRDCENDRRSATTHSRREGAHSQNRRLCLAQPLIFPLFELAQKLAAPAEHAVQSEAGNSAQSVGSWATVPYRKFTRNRMVERRGNCRIIFNFCHHYLSNGHGRPFAVPSFRYMCTILPRGFLTLAARTWREESLPCLCGTRSNPRCACRSRREPHSSISGHHSGQ